MRCEDAQKLLIECAGGELEADIERVVREHASSCTSCGTELDALERTMCLLKDDGYREPSPFYWTRFDARLRGRLRGAHAAAGNAPWAWAVPRLAPVGVAVACFVIGMWVGLGPGARPSAPLGVAPSAERGTAVADLPVISARSKLLVQTGATQGYDAQTYATNVPDTLTPRDFDPLDQGPHVVLATSESQVSVERLLGQRLPRE
jgi:anti-sigma factor RsiW